MFISGVPGPAMPHTPAVEWFMMDFETGKLTLNAYDLVIQI